MRFALLFLLTANLFAVEAQHYTTVEPTREHHAKGFRRKDVKLPEHVNREMAVQIPDSLDLRPKISPILNQGQCGSCYAHGTISSVRDALMLAGKDPGALSPQMLMDYSGDGCNGGYFDVLQLVVSPNAPLASNYPYTAQNQGKQNLVKPLTAIGSWAMLGSNGVVTPKDIETFMVQYNAPVPITISAGSGNFEYYSSGIYDGCVNGAIDHLVAIVGFANEGAQFGSNGYLPASKGYWIVRNSWGATWGEQGYVRIRMTDTAGNKCNGVADQAAGFFLTQAGLKK